jgi:hypothetical protein
VNLHQSVSPDEPPRDVSIPDDSDLLSQAARRIHDGLSIAEIRQELFGVYVAGYKAGAQLVLSARTEKLDVDPAAVTP